ncbi:MAG: hypothetical protein R3C14_22435 [Caldilineaceae bacterium]
MIEVFVNECSLHDQFYGQGEVATAFRQFFTTLNVFNQHQATYTIYHHENLFTIYSITQSEPLIATLNTLRDKSLARAIKGILFDRLNAQDWQTTRLHSSDDIFTCLEEIVTDTSMAELAERKLQNDALLGLLVNFPFSKFAKQFIVDITKNDGEPSSIDCLDEKDALARWLNDHLQTERFVYDYTSSFRPTDLQTVLRDGQRFFSTSYYVDGRRVYREINTEYYWYVDNLHYGRAAHLEVFDRNGQHLGEATLEGAIDTTKRDFTKRLKL